MLNKIKKRSVRYLVALSRDTCKKHPLYNDLLKYCRLYNLRYETHNQRLIIIYTRFGKICLKPYMTRCIAFDTVIGNTWDFQAETVPTLLRKLHKHQLISNGWFNFLKP